MAVPDRYAPPSPRPPTEKWGELQALCFPKLRRHTPDYPHFRGRMTARGTEFDLALWKRQAYKYGRLTTYYTLEFTFTHARDWWAARADKRWDVPVPERWPSYCYGWAMPTKYPVTPKNPNFHGSANVDGRFYRVSVWNRVHEVSKVIGGEPQYVEYPALRVVLRPAEAKIIDMLAHKMLPEAARPAYLADHDSHRRWLLGERDNPADHADEYEYEKEQERRRKRGEYC